ncbi:MT-A70 family methyltransferase [Erwinia pyri]|uniref:MT-A70 family methyltransferase n=1 Tax=Erwinia pyri TaxID=3062598 RepID=A0AA50DFJ1_9GAMM|nr:MT-A70 family methyltransferase [Erwinia sp. DE2]WLS77239.1 MT-A70 family methyltransferase [Erwinia sp. DE2]
MKYGLIYADPPWQYGNTISRGAADGHYSTMNLTDLKRPPVWELAEDNSVLVMWYTGTHVEEARFRLEELYGDVSHIELFSRRPSEGWDIWGNECENSIQLVPGRVA